MSGHYCYLWEFIVAPADEAAFLAAYGPDGTWVQLFRRASGYLGTRLLRDDTTPGRFLTIDSWLSEAHHTAFRARFAAEYDALDRELEGLTQHEASLGSFREEAP